MAEVSLFEAKNKAVSMARLLSVRLGHIARQVIMAGALILTLATANPAAANQRGDAVNAANAFILGCFG